MEEKDKNIEVETANSQNNLIGGEYPHCYSR